MRQLNRLAGRARVFARRPPEPRWRRPLRRGLALLVCATLATMLHREAVVRGWPELARVALLDKADRLALRTGLVVGEVYASKSPSTAPDELRGALADVVGMSMVRVDLEVLRLRLRELPYVREASIARVLPDRLEVRLDEHQPIALFLGPAGLRLVDRDGLTIPLRNVDDFDELLLVSGDGAPERAHGLVSLLERHPSLAERITAAHLVSGRRWNLYLDGQIELRLPADSLQQAFDRLARLQATQGLLDRAIEMVDLRRPGAVAVRLRTPAAAPGAGVRA